MLEKIKFATGNEGKLKEARAILGFEVEQVDVDLIEIQAVDVEEVTKHKAKEGFDQVGEPVMVEDTALEFEGLNGLPGALIKWFMKSVDNEGLTEMLTEGKSRKATAVTCIGYHDGSETIIVRGEIQGTISDKPRGENGFGWDKIFIPDGYKKTFAEMTDDEKNSMSMRKRAFENLKKKLN